MDCVAKINEISATGACKSCGTCIAVCPANALQMVELPSGYLVANIKDDLCTNCGLCLKVCPSISLDLSDLSDDVDLFEGPVITTFCGYSTRIRPQGQSGGVVTELVDYILQSKKADKALLTRMPHDGRLRPEPFYAHQFKEVLSACGSKYCPVALNQLLRTNPKNREKVCVVGLPCHLHGIANLLTTPCKNVEDIAFSIGLFCDRTMTFNAMECLVEKTGLSREEVKTLSFRSKEDSGWPGNVRIESNVGEVQFLDARERMKIKDAFTPLACRTCFDKMNIFADVAIGDAYGLRSDTEGWSVILARTERGLDVLRQAQVNGHLALEEVSVADVMEGQKLDKRRKDWATFGLIRGSKTHCRLDGISIERFPEAEAGRKLRKKKKLIKQAKNIFSAKTKSQALRRARRILKKTR